MYDHVVYESMCIVSLLSMGGVGAVGLHLEYILQMQ